MFWTWSVKEILCGIPNAVILVHCLNLITWLLELVHPCLTDPRKVRNWGRTSPGAVRVGRAGRLILRGDCVGKSGQFPDFRFPDFPKS